MEKVEPQVEPSRSSRSVHTHLHGVGVARYELTTAEHRRLCCDGTEQSTIRTRSLLISFCILLALSKREVEKTEGGRKSSTWVSLQSWFSNLDLCSHDVQPPTPVIRLVCCLRPAKCDGNVCLRPNKITKLPFGVHESCLFLNGEMLKISHTKITHCRRYCNRFVAVRTQEKSHFHPRLDFVSHECVEHKSDKMKGTEQYIRSKFKVSYWQTDGFFAFRGVSWITSWCMELANCRLSNPRWLFTRNICKGIKQGHLKTLFSHRYHWAPSYNHLDICHCIIWPEQSLICGNTN